MKQFFKTVFASTLGVLIASGIMILGSVMLLLGIVATTESTQAYTPAANTVFKLELKGSLSEQVSKNPFAELMGEENGATSVSDIIKAIRKAKEDDNIKGIYIDAGNLSAGFASLEAIRRELKDFKTSNKFIVSYGDYYTQGSYYLCSVSDSIYLNPEGSVSLVGLASQGIFYTGLAEKLGVEHYIFKVGTYKSAVEPFFLKKFSDANREQLTSFLNSIWGNVTSAIEKDRNIAPEVLSDYLNEGKAMGKATNAIDSKLADVLCYRYEAENSVKALAGIEAKDKLKTAKVSKVASIVDKKKENENKIAVLYAEGEITRDNSTSPYSMNQNLITEKITKELRKLKDDESVKAVVFRVNSPGGDAYISEQIWKDVVELKAVKPVVVSMGNMATSGGYYISCGASKIVAERTTLTGSIGVFGVLRNLTGTYEKVGLTTDVVKTNTFADLGDVSRIMREDEKALIQKNVENTYDLFLTRCADGRGMTKEEIDTIGQGRVWTGEQAKEKGLVDELGGMDDAIKLAAGLADLTDYSIKEAAGPKDFFTEYFEKKMEEVKMSWVKSMLGDDYKIFNTLQKSKVNEGIMARMPYEITEF